MNSELRDLLASPFVIASEIERCLSSFAPEHDPYLVEDGQAYPLQRPEAPEDSQALRVALGNVPALGRRLSAWRSAVFDLEARNAKRLSVLVAGIIGLTSVDGSEALQGKLTRHLYGQWDVRGKDVAGASRDDFVRWTRRYDLLPRSWRYVRCDVPTQAIDAPQRRRS